MLGDDAGVLCRVVVIYICVQLRVSCGDAAVAAQASSKTGFSAYHRKKYTSEYGMMESSDALQQTADLKKKKAIAIVFVVLVYLIS